MGKLRQGLNSTKYDVAIWGMNNTRSLVTLRRVAEACVKEGLRTVLLWWEYRGSSARTPADYPVAGLEFQKVPVRYDYGIFRYPHPYTLLRIQGKICRTLSEISTRCLVTQLDHAFADRVWQRAAKRLGIPGIVLQEGMTNEPKGAWRGSNSKRKWAWRWVQQPWHQKWIWAIPHPLLKADAPYMYADYAFVWGEAMKNLLVKFGRTPDSITVTGSPAMDHISGQEPLAPADLKSVLYVHQPMKISLDIKRQNYEDIIRTVVLEHGCKLLFKLHPGCAYEAENIRALVQLLGCPCGSVEVIDEGNAVDMLDKASVVVVATSTTGYHAAVAGVPLVVLDYYFEDVCFNVGDSGGAAVVRSAEELSEIMGKALFDMGYRDQLHRGSGRMLRDHLFALDGCSASRVVAAIRNVAL